MSLATLTSKDLSKIQKLIERKEALAQQIDAINRELEAIESGVSQSPDPAIPTNGTTATPRGRKASTPAVSRRRAGRTQPGGLKERITSELQSAGNQGLKIKDLATKLGTSYGNVTAFFHSTGKKIKTIKKIGRGRYSWTGA